MQQRHCVHTEPTVITAATAVTEPTATLTSNYASMNRIYAHLCAFFASFFFVLCDRNSFSTTHTYAVMRRVLLKKKSSSNNPRYFWTIERTNTRTNTHVIHSILFDVWKKRSISKCNSVRVRAQHLPINYSSLFCVLFFVLNWQSRGLYTAFWEIFFSLKRKTFNVLKPILDQHTRRMEWMENRFGKQISSHLLHTKQSTWTS